MSWQTVSRVAELSKARLGARLVMYALANHDAELGCFVSLDRIAHESLLSVRQVQRCLRELQGIGELAIAYGEGPHGTNRYTFLLPEVAPLDTRQSVTPQNPHPDKSSPDMSPELKELGLGSALVVTQTSTSGNALDPATVTPHQRMFGEVCTAMGYPETLASADAREVGGVAKALIEKGLDAEEVPQFVEWLTGPESPIVNGTRLTLHSLPKWVKDWRSAGRFVVKPTRPKRNVDNIAAIARRMGGLT